MVFKLVRIDISDACKVQLQEGSHNIGRGTFLKTLECDDKRVSRKHGRLDVDKDSVTLTALNRNPCFYLKKQASETQILQFESSICLANGDRFGLLPNTYWYELILCSDDVHTEEQNPAINDNQEKVNNDSDSLDLTLEEEIQLNALEDVAAAMADSDSPSLLSPTEAVNPDLNIETSENTEDYVPSATVKRSHSQVKDNVRVMEEGESCAKVKVKEEPDGEIPGTSHDNDNVQNQNNARQNIPSPQKTSNNILLRERCWYGASCYRRNPTHKQEFSHPNDPDWGDDNRQCPYGASCTKTDARHWRDHRHPMAQPQPPPAGRRKKKKVVQVSESEDDEMSSNDSEILPAKRVRKPIRKLDKYNSTDSESEQDPYDTDEDSEEWVPSQLTGSSQEFSQTQDF